MYEFFFLFWVGRRTLTTFLQEDSKKKSKKTKSGTTPVREGWGSQKRKPDFLHTETKKERYASTNKQKKKKVTVHLWNVFLQL